MNKLYSIPLQSPKQMIKNNSQKNLSLNRVSETGKEKKNKQVIFILLIKHY